MTIKLDEVEANIASEVGIKRNIEALFKSRKNNYEDTWIGESWANHIEGACAELAVCNFLNRRWDRSVNVFTREDINGTNIDVKWSRKPYLIIEPKNPFILVLINGSCPNYEVLGWARPDEFKRPQFKAVFGDQREHYRVPKEVLRPAYSLAQEFSLQDNGIGVNRVKQWLKSNI